MTLKNKSTTGIRFVVLKYLLPFSLIIAIVVVTGQTVFFKGIYKKRVSHLLQKASNELIESFVSDDPNKFSKDVTSYVIESNIYTCVYDSNHNYQQSVINMYRPNYNELEVDILLDRIDNENKNNITETIDNKKMMCSISKVNKNGISYYIAVFMELLPIDAVVATLNIGMYIIVIVLLSLSWLISYYVSLKLARPLKQLEQKASLLSKNDPNLVFDVKGYDEVESLSETLNYANKEICKSSKLQKSIIANVSHDLRTPLTLIKAYAEMIKDISGNNPEKRNEHLDIIIKETDRLTSLVNNILEISKLENNMELVITRFNLSKMVEETVLAFDILSNEGYVFKTNVDPNIYVEGDEEKLKQALYNLISNAVNYTIEKEVTVNLTFNEGKALVEVIDKGNGIPEDKLETIWERYYRDDENHVRSVVGSGLGLSIVKGVFEKHNLEYGVKSKINEGSIFYFVIFGEKMS